MEIQYEHCDVIVDQKRLVEGNTVVAQYPTSSTTDGGPGHPRPKASNKLGAAEPVTMGGIVQQVGAEHRISKPDVTKSCWTGFSSQTLDSLDG